RQGTPIGSPDTVIQALKEWESIGVDRMVFLINYDQVIPHEKIMASLRLFADQVMPHFKEPEQPSLTTAPALDLMRQREKAAVEGVSPPCQRAISSAGRRRASGLSPSG